MKKYNDPNMNLVRFDVEDVTNFIIDDPNNPNPGSGDNDVPSDKITSGAGGAINSSVNWM